MRLIDADALIDQAINGMFPKLYNQLCFCPKDIDHAPTVDPVKHGHWVCHPDPDKMALVCSICGQVMPFVPEYLPEEPPYCNCGARMDGEV